MTTRRKGNNVNPKPNAARNKRNVPGSGSEGFKGRFGADSLFQPIHWSDKKAQIKRISKEVVKAKFEQLSFDGIGVKGEILLFADSDVWSKLPSEWEKGKG